MKLTTLQEQATTVENNMQTSEEIAQAYEEKNKVRIKRFCEFLLICCVSLLGRPLLAPPQCFPCWRDVRFDPKNSILMTQLCMSVKFISFPCS